MTNITYQRRRISIAAILILFTALFIGQGNALAQGGITYLEITGETNPEVNDSEVYTLNQAAQGTVTWSVSSSGTITSSTQTTCTVTWDAAGTGYVQVEEAGAGMPVTLFVNVATTGGTTPGTKPTIIRALNIARVYQVKKPNLIDFDQVTAEPEPEDVIVQSGYFDGLGRSQQSVIKMLTPDEKDFVSVSEYDEYGRVVEQYLPYKASTSDGKLKTGTTDRDNFYDTQYGTSETHPYSEVSYEPSPLNRPLESTGPGEDWHTNSKSVTTAYAFNTLAEGVFEWDGTQKTGIYAADELMVNTTTDEQGNAVKQYTNERGQVILKKVQEDASPGADHDGWLSTYYVYDDLQRLTYVIPPKAVATLAEGSSSVTLSTEIVNNLCFQYTYDNRGRMITKRVPGTDGVTEMVYDKMNRLVLSRDARQTAAGEWVFTRYDALSRPVMTGVLNASDSRASLQAGQNAATGYDMHYATSVDNSNTITGDILLLDGHIDGTTLYEAKNYIDVADGFVIDSSTSGTVDFETNGTLGAVNNYLMGYYDEAEPVLDENDRIESVTYYDRYDFTDKSFDNSYNSAMSVGTYLETPVATATAQGQATGSRTRIFGTDQWLESVIFYDKKGRVIQTQGENHLGGIDIVTNTYDFSGKLVYTYTHHKNPQANDFTELRVLKKYTYDHADRLEKVESRNINEESVYTVLAENTYDALGQLSQKALGGAQQTVDYDYNIRGWMTNINDVTTLGSDYFAMELKYTSEGLYNGNIGAIDWKSVGDSDLKGYTYSYDRLNRLTAAVFDHSNGTTYDGDFDMSATYDANGNILTLNRKGRVFNTAKDIDLLSYAYADNSNQLIKVGDTAGDNGIGDFKNGFNTDDDYSYDANGNLTKDENKSITNISYNRLNLPAVISFEDGHSIEFLYDASGIKLRKTTTTQPADAYSVLDISDFTSGTDGWSTYQTTATANQSIAGEDAAVKVTSNSADNLHRLQKNIGVTPDKKLRVRAKVYIPASNVTADGLLVQAGFSSADRSGILTTTNEWLELDYTTSAAMTSSYIFFHMTASGATSFTGTSGDHVYIKDIEVSTVTETQETEAEVKITDYVNGFIYEGNNLQQFAHEEGRVRKNDSGDLVYDFVIRDHLGNTRTTFTTETAPALVYKATMESENDSDGNSIKAYEERFFYNLDNSRVSLPTAANVSTLADDKCTDCNESAAVNGATNPIGPAIILDVMPGDELDLEVWAYAEGTVPNNTPLNTALISALTNAFVPAGVGSELGTQTSSILNAESAAVLASGSISTTVVNAYLNYVVFDQTFDAIDYGHQKIGGTINMSQLVSLNNITITEKGYIYVWVSNESDYDLNVFFDDLKVTHTKGPILQEDHYYPFGANISALSSSAPLSKPNKYKFNGIEQNTDFDLNTYDAFYRNYDPTLGRWWQVDPKASERESPYVGMGNNPILYNDYLGDTVKYANDDATRALQEQYSALRKQSKSFNTVLTLLEQSEVVVNIKVDEAAVDKVAEDKGLGESKEKVGGFADRSDNSITMRGGQSDKALAEEAFHVFQFITYGDERNTAEIESEAKLFDYDVVNEAADSRGDGFAFGPGGAESDITFVQFSQEDTGSRIIRGGSNRKAYNNYLKSFSRYQNSTGGAYKGTIRPLIPKAYNNVNTVQKINPRIRP